ncbi:MAG: phenylalanine--tRNA ligase subunit alpha [Candidatus Omnitrophica bacterium]|nr:phenylalanine--tRNA ligase subunit alpha [Candidatus Omnitrophota bacterium]
MTFDYETEKQNSRQKIAEAADIKQIEAVRLEYLGRKGKLAAMYANLTTLPIEQRPEEGKKINEFRDIITQLIEEKKKDIVSKERRGSLKQLDVTIPGVAHPIGHKHILTQTIEEICSIFEQLGFAVEEGPEIETEFNNFTALNIPADHPSRDGFDTFYLKQQDPSDKNVNLLLRSHTSPAQIRIMEKHKPPLAVVVPGKVYRPDAVDASHCFMFHQIEGLLVDADVKFSDLKGLLTVFLKRLFGEKIKMRFRPHFFPFTEPSAEVDISCYICEGEGCSVCSRKGWLEIMGCGMVHPEVFKAVGYPKGKYTGLAFGLGVERMTMLKHGIRDIRLFFENDIRFLEQF